MPARPEPRTATCPAVLYRVGRATGPVHFNEIDALDAELADVGNRFDVVGGGVMYAASDKIAAFKESLAEFRPAASSYALEALGGEHLMNVGSIPSSWRDKRKMLAFSLSEALPFLDVEKDETLTYLTGAMSAELTALGISNLDSALVRGPNRLLTRAIANWAYTQVDEDDEAIYSGIRYSSRFQSHECWAIFEGVQVGASSMQSIDAGDAELLAVAREFNLVVH